MQETHDNYRNLLKRYRAYAPNYDRRWGQYSAATLSKALEVIRSEGNPSLIDVACGTGLLIEMLLRENSRVRAVGVDISSDMLSKATERIPPQPGRVEWRVGTAEQLPVDSARFDVLTCTNAFHLIQDAAAALAEFRRVLKPGGTIVLVDWCRDFPVMKFRTAVLRYSDRQRRSIRTLRELLDLLSDTGFEVIEANRFTAGLWGLMRVHARTPVPVPSLQPIQPVIRAVECELSRH